MSAGQAQRAAAAAAVAAVEVWIRGRASEGLRKAPTSLRQMKTDEDPPEEFLETLFIDEV